MSNEFQDKLQLYKEGKLNQTEVTEIESDIDKFLAISDYLNNEEKDFLEDLKQQIEEPSGAETSSAKRLKRSVNLRIIMLTVISVFSALLVFLFLYFTASKITTSVFGLDYKEAYVKRETVVQLTKMFQPKYKSFSSSTGTSLFAQQNITVFLENTVGHTKIDETQLNVKYSLGKPVRSENSVGTPLLLDDFTPNLSHESDAVTGFKVLENAPQGTKARIFIEFNKALTPQQLKEHFITTITKETELIEITPIAAIDSTFALANPSYYQFTPVFPYDKTNDKQLEGNGLNQEKYENMDNLAHKESFINNLNLIKNNLDLLQVMYYDNMFESINFDDMIKQVETDGVAYVGMYISADSKELLKLKDNPFIHCISVDTIVIW